MMIWLQDTEVVWIDTATAEEAEQTVSTEKLRLRRLRSTACPVEIIKRDNTTTTSLRPESSRGIQVLASIWHSIEIKEDRPLNCIKSPMNRDPLHTATSCTWNTPQGNVSVLFLCQYIYLFRIEISAVGQFFYPIFSF